MAPQGERVGIAGVVRDVVAGLAPEELPVVDGLAALDTDAASRHVARASGARREPLGFGLGDVIVVVTPVVWVVVEHVAGRLADSATDSVLGRVRRRFRRRKSVAGGVELPLTPEHLDEVRRKALEVCAQRGMTPEQSQAIADAIADRLGPGDTGRE